MWWVISFVAAVLIFENFNRIHEVVKNKNYKFKKNKPEIQKLTKEERSILVDSLKDNIGKVCTLSSSKLIYVTDGYSITGLILDVDDSWISLEYTSKAFKKTTNLNHILIKTNIIDSFSVLVSKEYTESR